MPLDTTQPPDFWAELQQLASEFRAAAAQLLATIGGMVIDVSRVAYITVLLQGPSYASRGFTRRSGGS